jgi:hypothetical protein
MSSIDIKKELHEYIEDADDRLLKLIYGMIIADKQENDVPAWHKEIIEKRLEKHEQNPNDVISWEELKMSIEKMR